MSASFNEFVKSDTEIVPVFFEYNNDVNEGESLSSVVASSTNMLTGADSTSELISSSSLSGSVATVVLKAGVVGDTHKVTVRATTDLFGLYEKDVTVKILLQVEDHFAKQEAEIVTAENDFDNAIETGDSVSSATVTIIDRPTGVDVSAELDGGNSIIDNRVIYRIMSSSIVTEYLINIHVVTANSYEYDKYVFCRVLDK